MKQSKSRLARAAALAEKRANGPPKVSKYAAKRGKGYFHSDGTPVTRAELAELAAHFKGGA